MCQILLIRIQGVVILTILFRLPIRTFRTSLYSTDTVIPILEELAELLDFPGLLLLAHDLAGLNCCKVFFWCTTRRSTLQAKYIISAIELQKLPKFPSGTLVREFHFLLTSRRPWHHGRSQ